MSSTRPRYLPLRDYALVGDGVTAALVARDGSIDWHCVSGFDGDPVLCRLLDADRGGFLRVGPVAGEAVERRYVPGTNVLETIFEAPGGRMRLTDFMPLGRPAAPTRRPRILRRIDVLAGSVTLELDCRVTHDYGRLRPEAEVGRVVRFRGCGDVALAAPVPLERVEPNRVRGSLVARRGEPAWLEFGEGIPAGDDPDRELEETVGGWRSWSGASSYDGPHAALVRRSALTLKLLVHEPSGALVAAPTTSLPERHAGQTWDYRYAWLRDSGLVFDVLQTLGHHRESIRFFEWLGRLSIGCGAEVPILERVSGGGDLEEREIATLEGYHGHGPVRVGNAAAKQVQLDVTGHVVETAHLCHERMPRPLDPELAEVVRRLADHAGRRWREPDRGPWETRGEPRHHLYSKLYCWVALDRAAAMAEHHGLEGDVGAWRRARGEIRRAILTEGFDRETGSFRDAFGEAASGAAALLMPRVGFLPPHDRRLRTTILRVCRELSAGPFLRRHRAGIPAEAEGGFLPSSFWAVEALAAIGELDEANDRFDGIARAASDLGLLSEEVDPDSGDLLGNYPQAFSHLGLIRASRALAAASRAAVQGRASSSGVRSHRTSQSHRP